MSVVLHTPMTLAQFLAWEERQPPRYEFDGLHAMTSGTAAHDRIMFNLRKALDARLRGNRCQPWGLKITVDGRAGYPNAVVACVPVEPAATVLDAPVIVFEVLSEGSADTDLIDKNREYRAALSIQCYVIPRQTHAVAIVFVRRDEEWPSEIVVGDAALLSLPEIGIEVPLSEIYG